MALLLLTPAPMAATTAPPPPSPSAVPTTTVLDSRSKKKRLEIEDFTGAAENVAAWLVAIPNAVQRQLALYGEVWTEREYYGVSAHLKGPAGQWFHRLNAHIAPNCRTLDFLRSRLLDTYGSKVNVWETQLRLVQHRRQPGERLLDYANSLTEIGAENPGVTAECYVDAFIRGMNNRVFVQSVRTARPSTLEDAVSYAVEFCGQYGEGCEVTS